MSEQHLELHEGLDNDDEPTLSVSVRPEVAAGQVYEGVEYLLEDPSPEKKHEAVTRLAGLVAAWTDRSPDTSDAVQRCLADLLGVGSPTALTCAARLARSHAQTSWLVDTLADMLQRENFRVELFELTLELVPLSADDFEALVDLYDTPVRCVEPTEAAPSVLFGTASGVNLDEAYYVGESATVSAADARRFCRAFVEER